MDLFVRKSNAVAIGMYEKARRTPRLLAAPRGSRSGAAVWLLRVPASHRLLLRRGGRIRCARQVQPGVGRSAHAYARADMRKAMPRDVLKKSIIPLKRPVKPSELDDD